MSPAIRLDPRIVAGMRRQLALRDERIAAGDRQIGWKVGANAAAVQASLGIDRPLVGFLLGSGLIADGAKVDVSAWGAPAFEAEIAVRMSSDVAPGASREGVGRAIGGMAAAIELGDGHPPTDDLEQLIAANIGQRRVMLGKFDPARSTVDGVRARILRDGEEVAATDDPIAATGELTEVLRQTAELLEACGERLREGQVVITGTLTAPPALAPAQALVAEIPPLGTLSLRT